MPPPTTERLHIPNVLMDMLSEDTNKDSVNIPETTTEGLQHQVINTVLKLWPSKQDVTPNF